MLSTGSPVDQGHRLASYDTSLVVSGGVNCGRRRRNVYAKKPQRYAKDNRTAHLTARHKSVAYVTIKDSTRRFVLLKLTTDRHDASIARPLCVECRWGRPLCNSRATCSYPFPFNLHDHLEPIRFFTKNFNTNCPSPY